MSSFHKELLKAGKEFEQLQNKPSGTYKSNWSTSVEDKTMRDANGSTSYISTHRTEMSASYSHEKKDDGCKIS